jgi:hypothetical protein
MGGMRLPASHAPTFDLIDYVNDRIDSKNKEIKVEKRYPKLKIRNYFFDSRAASSFKGKDSDD